MEHPQKPKIIYKIKGVGIVIPGKKSKILAYPQSGYSRNPDGSGMTYIIPEVFAPLITSLRPVIVIGYYNY